MFFKKFIGNRQFYKRLFVILIPLALQQAVTSFVNLLDNVMVGQLGKQATSAVAVDNQLIFILNLAIFGMVSGASIYGAQFYGNRDEEGLRHTFRFKLIFTLIITAVFIAVLYLFSDELIGLFMKSEVNSAEDIELTTALARDYLGIMLFGLVPFAVVQIYSSSLKDCGETVTPMTASIIAIIVNLVFNYILIYGKFGFPRLEVKGAAIATVLSRFVEMFYIVIYTHVKARRWTFIRGVYRSLKMPVSFVRKVLITGAPLLLNEVMWSLGMTFINLNYASRGIDVVAAVNINTTVWNLFCVFMMASGSAVAIMIGQKLGAGDPEGAKSDASRLMAFTVVLHILIGILIIASSPFIPHLYNVSDEVRGLVTSLMIVAGASLPIHSFVHVSYFTIRSGGKTVVTFLFDSFYTWCVPAWISFFLCRYTDLSIVLIYFIVQFSDIIKLSIAVPMIKSGFWAKSVIGVEKCEKKESLK